MKRTLISLIIATVAIAASAQSYWGIRAGWNGTFPTDLKVADASMKMFTSGSGFYAGAIYNYPIVEGLYIEPGVNLCFDSNRFDDLTIEDGTTSYFNPKVKKFGLRVPVRLGYYFDIFPNKGGVSIFTGPELDLGISANISGADSLEGSERSLYSDFYGYHRFGISWTVGANIYIGNWVFDISGAFGLTDMQSSVWSMHQNRLTIGLGYNF